MAATAPPDTWAPKPGVGALPLSTRPWAITAATPKPSKRVASAAPPTTSGLRVLGASAKYFTDRLQVGGERRLELAATVVGGMVERQAVGVQERSAHGQRSSPPTVAGVAHHRVVDGGQVDPDLVGTAGLKVALDEGEG